MTSPFSTQVSENVRTTIWGALLEYALDHWIVLIAFALIVVVAAIYVITKD